MNTTARTAGPWSFRIGGKNRRGGMEIHRQDGEQAIIVAKGVKASSAATIVTACNAHEDLVAALRGLYTLYGVSNEWPSDHPAWVRARAALAKAGTL